jgi:hypothetical protein
MQYGQRYRQEGNSYWRKIYLLSIGNCGMPVLVLSGKNKEIKTVNKNLLHIAGFFTATLSSETV